jgi:site-specific DNA recombinase
MRAVAYSRVSSAAQRDRHTIESQHRDIPEYIKRNGWQLAKPVGAYVDDGRSAKAGKLEARDGFARLVEDAARGEFDIVVVVDLDRLTRTEDLAERGAILGAFQRAGVKIAVTSNGQLLDLSSSVGDLFSGLSAFFAAEENRKRRARTVAGKLTAIARGHKPSGPTPYGLRYDRTTRTWSLDPEKAPIALEIFERVASGGSCQAIADDFDARGVPRVRGGRWIRERVWAIARAATYRGVWLADKTRKLEVPVPRIVDDELWYAAQDALIRWGRRGLRRTKRVYLLEGLATCAACGARVGIAAASWTGRRQASRATYVCAHRRRPPLGGTRCELPHRPIEEVDARVWNALRELLEQPRLLEEAGAERASRAAGDARDWQKDVAGYEARLERLGRAEQVILARFRKGLVSEAAMDAELAASAQERSMLERQLDGAKRALADAGRTKANVAALEATLRQLRARLGQASLEEKRDLVRLLVEPGDVVLGSYEITVQVQLRAPSQDVSPESKAA